VKITSVVHNVDHDYVTIMIGDVTVVVHPSEVIAGAVNVEVDAETGQHVRIHVNDGAVYDERIPS
jgi:hypothetical protein